MGVQPMNQWKTRIIAGLAALAFAAFLFLLLPPAAGAAALESGPTARGSVEQVYVIGAQPGSAAQECFRASTENMP